ncbi:MAG: acyl carrier protein [Porticoccaceae bacterium]
MTSRQQVLQRLFVHLGRLARDKASIHADVDLVQELGLDSVEVMNLLMEIEDEFDISVPLNVLTEVRTPAQLAQAISDLLEAGGP